MLIVREIKAKKELDLNELKDLVRKKLKIDKTIVFDYFEIQKKAIDARKELFYIYNIIFEIQDENKYLKYSNVDKYEKINVEINKINSDIRPIIIGYGPSGIFAAYRLIEAGLKPIIFEKGSRINKREKDIELFFNKGIFNENSNVVYGEGGAGTFSDAKLTTRIKSPFISYITDIFIKHGAPNNIKYDSHPHIGTDLIRKVIENITDHLIDKGAEFHFDEEIIDFIIEDNQIKKVISNKKEYESNYVLLGIGHSSYKTVKKLFDKGVYIESKDTAIGFRVEHPQILIDKNQYGKFYNIDLPRSEYFLRHKDIKDVYSFCMCPGGFVIPSNNEINSICTNGMSYHDRSNHLANSAILIQVKKEEYGDDILGGFKYLEELEKKAYAISNSYCALAMNIKDYLNNELNDLIFESSYTLGITKYNLNNFYNEKDNEIFKRALLDFDKKIKGFIDEGIMVGPETRASSPIRIKRNEYLESINTKGLYPIGEGAGYGGGIMSCSLDGIRIADRIIDILK